jgi:hypothetical protein
VSTKKSPTYTDKSGRKIKLGWKGTWDTKLKRTTYTRCIELIVNGKSLYLDEPNVHGRFDSEEILAAYAEENGYHLEQGVLSL